jgi:hypothetical protein
MESKICTRFWPIWQKRIHRAEIEVTTLKKKRGAVLVVLGIVVELVGAAGIAVTSDMLETQHRKEIAELNRATEVLRAKNNVLEVRMATPDISRSVHIMVVRQPTKKIWP